MSLRIRRIAPDDIPSSRLTLEALASVLKPTIVAEAIDECGAREKRARKLPATAVLLLCVAMNLYSEECLSHVFLRLLGRMRWLLADPGAIRVSKSALCQARYRLGAKPMVELFRRVGEPLSTPEVPGALLFGLRPMALDSAPVDLPDTPENVRAFGKPGSSRGESAWPQTRVVALCECSTHAVCDAGVWRHDSDERACGRRLLRSVGEGVLLLWDRGFHGFDMVCAALCRGCDLLGRLPATVKPETRWTLPDASALVWLRPSERKRREHANMGSASFCGWCDTP